jgi:hypothetical protein
LEFSFDSLLNARPLDVHVWSNYSEVNLFVNHIYNELSSLDGNEKINKKLLKVLLLDLYVCWSTDPNLKIMFSRDNNAYKAKSRYNELHIGKKIIAVADVLVAEDWIYEVRGFNDRVSGVGFQSRLAPSDRLISFFEEAKFHKFFVQSHPDRETVVLRSGDKVNVENYEDNRISKRSRSILKDYNALLDRTHIDIESLHQPQISIGHGKKSMCLPISQSNKFVRRIFNDESWNKGGRFYGGWWQRCPKQYRINITLDDIPTAELDFSGLHIVLLYALEGINYWADIAEDPYEVEPKIPFDTDIDLRATAKLLLLTALNSDDEKITFGAFRSHAGSNILQKKLTDIELKSMLDALRLKHPKIEHKLAEGVGKDLMFIDSQITELLIERFTYHYECPILTIHDSYVVPFGYDDILKQEMEIAFEKVTGVNNPVIKHTTYHYTELQQEFVDGDYPKNSWLSSHATERHKQDWELFKEFKGKPEREKWVPDWTMIF